MYGDAPPELALNLSVAVPWGVRPKVANNRSSENSGLVQSNLTKFQDPQRRI